MRCEYEADRAAHAVFGHRFDGVAQKRVPVPHSHVHGKLVTLRCQPLLESARLLHGDLRDWRDTAESLVVMDDLLDPLWRHAASAKDVRKKRSYVLWASRSAECHDEHGVEGVHMPEKRACTIVWRRANSAARGRLISRAVRCFISCPPGMCVSTLILVQALIGADWLEQMRVPPDRERAAHLLVAKSPPDDIAVVPHLPADAYRSDGPIARA